MGTTNLLILPGPLRCSCRKLPYPKMNHSPSGDHAGESERTPAGQAKFIESLFGVAP